MGTLLQIFVKLIRITITLAITTFVIISIVLFITDGINSKKEGRNRKTRYTVMFIISMVIIALTVIMGILLIILATLFMRSM